MPTTIHDIAREAGVSIATVSKVINNKAHVAHTTREKVLKVMDQLNYVPNASAANLARRFSKNCMRIGFTKDCRMKILICLILSAASATNWVEKDTGYPCSTWIRLGKNRRKCLRKRSTAG